MMERTPTVFVVDEDPLARSSVRQSVSMLNWHCEDYASGREFFEGFDPSRPGCVVLENRIPDICGLEIQQRLAGLAPATPVVFVTGHATVSAAVRAMRAGAVHLLEKPIRETELWEVLQEAISVNQRRRQLVDRQQKAQAKIAQLTSKERDVMKGVVAGAANAEMASKFNVALRTLELRRAKMLRKLQVGSVAALIRLVTDAENGHWPALPGHPRVIPSADGRRSSPPAGRRGNGEESANDRGAGSP